MARTLLIIAVLLMLTGCPPKPPANDNTAQQLAEKTVELQRARDSKGFWQLTAAILGSLIILALVVGMVLGSRAKEDADEQ